MPAAEPDRPYTLRDVDNMLTERLPQAEHSWLRDPEGNPSVRAYGSRHLPSQPVYVNYRPSVVKMQLRFTPRRISPTRAEELWAAAEAAGPVLRSAKVQSRRQMGHTQETERDEQWVVTLPERLSEDGYAALESFITLAAACMGIEAEDE
jgi:hypothetical protein